MCIPPCCATAPTCSVPEDSSWGRQGRVAGVLWRGGMSWDELGEQPPLFSPARGTRRCAAVPGPRAPGRAARCSRVHQGLRCCLLAPQLRALLLSWCPTRCPCPGICPQPLRPGATAHSRVGEAPVPPLQREEAKFRGHPWHQAPHLGAAAACARLGLRLLPKSGRGLLEDGHGGLTATHWPPPAAALPAWWHTQQVIFLCRA